MVLPIPAKHVEPQELLTSFVQPELTVPSLHTEPGGLTSLGQLKWPVSSQYAELPCASLVDPGLPTPAKQGKLQVSVTILGEHGQTGHAPVACLHVLKPNLHVPVLSTHNQ